MAWKGAYHSLAIAAARPLRPPLASLLRRYTSRLSPRSIGRLEEAPPGSSWRAAPGATTPSPLSTSAKPAPFPAAKAEAGNDESKTAPGLGGQPRHGASGDSGSSLRRGPGGGAEGDAGVDAAAAVTADKGASSASPGVKANSADETERMVPGPFGEPRKPQRVEVEFGSFHEFTVINKTGGKLFEASRELIPAEEAIAFPTMKASSLAGGPEVEFPRRLTGRVTLAGLFHRQFGYSMLPTWTKPFVEAFGVPGTGSAGRITPSTVQVSLLESWTLRLLRPVLVPTMALGVSRDEKAAFYYRFGQTDELRKALGIENRLTLYVFLVDQEGRVRWRATGKGTPDELEYLVRCARQLADGKG